MKKCEEQKQNGASGALSSKISQLKKEIQTYRFASIKEKLQRNANTVADSTCSLLELSKLRKDISVTDENGQEDALSFRMANPLIKLSGLTHGSGEKDTINVPDITSSMMIKLPKVEKIPPYTTWIFLDKNQRMPEDQSVVGKRQIYYDGGETLISSDSEEDIAEPEEEKHWFSDGDDQILWKVLQEYGLTEEVLNTVSQSIGTTPSEIQNRYNILMQTYQEKRAKIVQNSEEKLPDVNCEQSLDAALDSFDNIFCRRCLVFDCRLHGCSQSIITPVEKLPSACKVGENKEPCSDLCYLLARSISEASAEKDRMQLSPRNEEQSPGKRKELRRRSVTVQKPKVGSYDCWGNSNKKQKTIAGQDVVYVSPEAKPDSGFISKADTRLPGGGALRGNRPKNIKYSNEVVECEKIIDNVVELERSNDTEAPIMEQNEQFQGEVEGAFHSCEWRPLEKELYSKGIEVFGRNSCLISRNMLPGLKTCIEVFNYMFKDENVMTSAASPNSCIDANGKSETDSKPEMPSRSRRGKPRKLKYTWKSAGHPSSRKRIAGGKNIVNKQYTPCDCELTCGKGCSCLLTETCCEKYCGCSKSCKNRFRGCHCAKSQCRTRQCPCFAADRECDPDVCRNCWISCGDGSLGEPPARGDGYQCGNMKLFLKQQQSVLLAKSDVAGWGAYLKNPVTKNEYLGEYTGEVISTKEADKRGKIYDRANSSYLFDLNDQSVLDAYRRGDKLKFANHSSKPNCYAKVKLVAGDHRVGIYAMENIKAGEELFYDYCYAPDTQYVWARRSEGLKKDESPGPSARARKHQSC